MNSHLVFSSDDEHPPIGGKAESLLRLKRAGFQVPQFFVALKGASDAEILRAFDEVFEPSTVVAVRSSALGEDSMEHSFAGQFDSFLEIARDDVPEYCRKVWASGGSDRVAAYGEQTGGKATEPAALVQSMIPADVAGVAFSADPVSGIRHQAVVSAVPGLGEKLVSGEVNSDMFVVDVDGYILRQELVGEKACLKVEQVRQVAGLSRKCAAHYQHPQDIEWAIKGGKLWLLQSRPITSLRRRPDPSATHRIWDNSNIAESYSGVTTPLTFTFASRAYEAVYREFCVLLGVPKERLEANDDIFPAMIGLIRGRVYYNLVSWYRVIAMLPGFQANREFMEQMMGVKEPMPDSIVRKIQERNTTSAFRDRLDLVRTLVGLVYRQMTLPRDIRRFYKRLKRALDNPPAPMGDPEAYVAHYRELEQQLLRKWDAPLVNDFFAMIYCGVLKKLTAKWCGDESGALANDLLRDIGEIISTEPARRIREMAEIKAGGGDIKAKLDEYLEKFGDRCIEELKLESPSLREDAGPLMTSIAAMAERIRSGNAPKPEVAKVEIPDLPQPRKALFTWVLNQARARVRDRENLRFERTRIFGRVRQIMRRLGAHLAEDGFIEQTEDIFYLQLEEILRHYEGTSAQIISPDLLKLRKDEFAEYREEDPPPDRFETFGPPAMYEEFVDLLAEKVNARIEDGDLQGTGACAGIVRGLVRVVRDPRGVTLEPGEILVAQQTDPGWVVLFPAASALLVERGSLLSHSAIVAREMGIPAIVSIPALTQILEDGMEVEMDGSIGVVRILSK